MPAWTYLDFAGTIIISENDEGLRKYEREILTSPKLCDNTCNPFRVIGWNRRMKYHKGHTMQNCTLKLARFQHYMEPHTRLSR